MPLFRPGNTPAFADFGLSYALQLQGQTVPQNVVDLIPASGGIITVPSYQRGIEWGRDEVISLLESNSAIFGTVVLAIVQAQPMELVDGLQRFATVTALLKSLYPKVLASSPSIPSAAALPEFTTLRAKAGGYEPIITHNHSLLLNHPRQAIRDGYEELFDNVDEQIVSKELSSSPQLYQNAQTFAGKLNQMLLAKQIAIDPYYGFGSHLDLVNTFINMNSKGLDLSEVDLLRAKLVDQALELSWPSIDTALMENHFTDTFEGKQQVKVLGTVLNSAFDGERQTSIFPNWSHLTVQDVRGFLSFLDTSVVSATSTSSNFPYLREIYDCGGYPFSIAVLYYHLSSLSPGQPDFVSSTGQASSNDCHLLLRACYRRLIDGTISRIGQVADGMIQGSYSSLSAIVDAINPPLAGPIANSPNSEWLFERLRQSDARRAARIFNAMLLPDRTQPGGQFVPLKFGRGSTHWQVDHLIPKANLQQNMRGIAEGRRVTNLAPLPSRVNNQQRNQYCRLKLGPSGAYPASIQNPPPPITAANPHPYINWLVNTQYQLCSASSQLNSLDDQALLEPNSTPPIGDQRIQEMVSILINKL